MDYAGNNIVGGPGHRPSWSGGVAAPSEKESAKHPKRRRRGGGSGSKTFPFDLEPPPRFPLHQRKLRDISLDVASTPPGGGGGDGPVPPGRSLPTALASWNNVSRPSRRHLMSTASLPTFTRPRFYVGMAAFMSLMVLVGFWPTYFGQILSGIPNRHWVVHLHGWIFVGWMALLVTQVILAATGKNSGASLAGNFRYCLRFSGSRHGTNRQRCLARHTCSGRGSDDG